MNNKQQAFSDKWHYKVVVPKGKYQIPQKEYVVTAALLDHGAEDGISIFAIMATDYTPENKQWITFHLNSQEVEDLDNAFEIKE
jgi:hypothetical protein